MNENVTHLRYERKCYHFGVLAARKKTHKKNVFRYGVASSHQTAKPSLGWLRVGVRKTRLVLAEIRATRNEVTAKAGAYCRGGGKCHMEIRLISTRRRPPRFFGHTSSHVPEEKILVQGCSTRSMAGGGAVSSLDRGSGVGGSTSPH